MSLKQIYLFSSFSDEQLKKIAPLAVVKRFKYGNILFYQGDAPKSLIILTQGILKVYKTDARGNEVVLHYFRPVTTVAEAANLQKIPYPATAVFETDGEVVLIEWSEFEQMMLADSAIPLAMLGSLTKKIRNLEAVIDQNLTKDATSRVAKFAYENESALPVLSGKKIAEMLNIKPETLSRSLKRLRQDGSLQDAPKSIVIKDMAKLRKWF